MTAPVPAAVAAGAEPGLGEDEEPRGRVGVARRTERDGTPVGPFDRLGERIRRHGVSYRSADEVASPTMHDVFDLPQVQTLLQQADEAQAMLEQQPSPTVREVLREIHRELGALVHGWARRVERGEAPGAFLADFTGEVEHTAIPSPAESGRFEASATPGELHPVTLSELAEPRGALVVPLASSGVFDVLALPDDLGDPAVIPDEAAIVQWASAELDGRFAAVPRPVQAILLAMLAARARNVSAYLEVDIGPRMALERLRRHREREDLPWVAGLIPGARPEKSTWAEEARACWGLLRSA